MDIGQSLILGVVEGLSEFLPISSTAHLVLTAKLLNLGQTEFVKTFEISIQLGAILAVVVLYWSKFFNKQLLWRLFASWLPTVVIGFLLYKIFKNNFLMNYQLIAWMLLLGGLVMIFLDLWRREKKDMSVEMENISYLNCIIIGFVQAISIVPGVSRAAATIIGGLLLGLPKKTIVEYSFLLAVPTMLAATGYDFLKSGFIVSSENMLVLMFGFISSFFVAMLSVKLLLNFIKKNNFMAFGFYRLVIGFTILYFLYY